MPDSGASTHSRWTVWWHGFALIVAALGVGVVLIALAFLVLRAQATYTLESRIGQVETTCADHQLKYKAKADELDARLHFLERTLFGDVIPKVDKNSNSRGVPRMEELHFQNERELRARVERVERRLLRLED